ncbi:MAG: hypothetical protein ACOYJR_09525 [Acutalibacteraceae bacterium]
MDKESKYKIGNGKMPVILMLLMSALLGGLTLWLYKTNNGAVIFAGISDSLMELLLILTIYRLIFYKVLIGVDGFYYPKDNVKCYSGTRRMFDGRQGFLAE